VNCRICRRLDTSFDQPHPELVPRQRSSFGKRGD
jgi:hypothetical protein